MNNKNNMEVSNKKNRSNKEMKSKNKRKSNIYKRDNGDDRTFERRMRKKELKVNSLGVAVNFLGVVVTVIIAIAAGNAISQYYSLNENIINNGENINNEGTINGIINNAKIINNNYGEKISTSQMLQNALIYYKNEQYEDAFKEYVKCIENNSAIANLNIGYMYSHGLGCDIDYDQAKHYYTEAVKLGMEEDGIRNYLALNLIRPNDLERTIEALKYGYNRSDKNTIRYLSYLQTGVMYAEIQDCCYENADVIINKINQNEQLDLEGKLLVSNVEIQKINSGYTPQDTMFKKYLKYKNGLEKFVVGTTSKLIPVNGEYKEILINVFDLEEYEYYVVTNYKFNFSDTLFSEKFYEYINI